MGQVHSQTAQWWRKYKISLKYLFKTSFGTFTQNDVSIEVSNKIMLILKNIIQWPSKNEWFFNWYFIFNIDTDIFLQINQN